MVLISVWLILSVGELFAEAPRIEFKGESAGRSQVYKVEILVKLLVGEVENVDSLQAICEAVDTLGSGLTVTIKLKGFPTQFPLFGIMVYVEIPPESTPL